MTAATAVPIALSLFLFQIPAQPTTTAIQGRVVRYATTLPVANARVVAAKVGGALSDYRTTTADAAGRFAFSDLTPGTYRVYAQHEAYLQVEYGRRLAGLTGTPIELTGRTTPVEIVIAMTPTGVIAGRISDRGMPARNVIVRALKPMYFDGRRTLSIPEYAETDDRGEYRLSGLAPGLYLVSAAPPRQPRIEGDSLIVPVVPTVGNSNISQRKAPLTPETMDPAALDLDGYPAVYHPGTTDASMAIPIQVKAGATITGIDLAIARTPIFHVRGRVVFSGGTAQQPVSVGVTQVDSGTTSGIPSVMTNSGPFDLSSVLPGKYYLTAQTNAAAGRLAATLPLEVVDRDLDNIIVTLQPGVIVRGRIVIDGRVLASSDLPMSLNLRSDHGFGGYFAAGQPDGNFSFENVAVGEYRVAVNLGTKRLWTKVASFGATDVSSAPLRVEQDLQGKTLEIVLSPSPPSLEVLVVDEKRQPVTGALVIAVPDVPRRNRSSLYRTATTGSDGRARIDVIAPGEYTLFATEEIEAASWQDPNVIRQHENQGQAVSLREGVGQTVTVRIVNRATGGTKAPGPGR